MPVLAAAATLVVLALGGLLVRGHLTSVQAPTTQAPRLASRTDIGLPATVGTPAAPAPVRPDRTKRTATSRPEPATADAAVTTASPSPAIHADSERTAESLAASVFDLAPIAEPTIRVAPLEALRTVGPPQMAIAPIAITPLTVGPVDTLSAAAQGDHR